MTVSAPDLIRKRLTEEFSPQSIDVADDSALHVGHAGAAGGGGHYRVRVIAAAFAGMTRVQRHRRIYAALGDLMHSKVHALAIDARAPGEPAG
jgi:BolA family transcriptional regulator, general stress-responsive regulator